MSKYTLNICGVPTSVEFVKNEEYFSSDGKMSLGYFDTSDNSIKIACKGKDTDKLHRILLHEIIHAIFSHSGLWQHFYRLDNGEDNLEELICANLESFLSPLVSIDIDQFIEDLPVVEVVAKEPKKKKKKGRGK